MVDGGANEINVLNEAALKSQDADGESRGGTGAGRGEAGSRRHGDSLRANDVVEAKRAYFVQ